VGNKGQTFRLRLLILAVLLLLLISVLPIVRSTAATTQAAAVRGPYLQKVSPSTVIVRWRTNVATNSRVRIGTRPDSLNRAIDISGSRTDHAVRISGLRSRTRYFYSIGSSVTTMAQGAGFYFFTAPSSGVAVPTRLWVVGDAGTGTSEALAVRNAFYRLNTGRYLDMMILLGDNAYPNGSDAEYQRGFFNVFGTQLRRTILWSTIGNHDTALSTNPPPDIPYYRIFEFPRFAEAGGMSSGTEDYYSFNYGNIHFVCLDSTTSEISPSSAMVNWLRHNLSNNTKTWTIVFWHHPPYSKGGHDSDREVRMVRMREVVVPVLEQYGVDLVMTGHSHGYERTYLIDGHYGSSRTFRSSMIKDRGNGRENGSGAYVKAKGGHKGTVYVVAGSAGKVTSGSFDHPAMYYDTKSLGSFVVDVNGNRLDAKFLRSTGVVADYFTIKKN
jgi:hypothetical protein